MYSRQPNTSSKSTSSLISLLKSSTNGIDSFSSPIYFLNACSQSASNTSNSNSSGGGGGSGAIGRFNWLASKRTSKSCLRNIYPETRYDRQFDNLFITQQIAELFISFSIWNNGQTKYMTHSDFHSLVK